MRQRQKPVVGAVYGVYVEELKKYGAEYLSEMDWRKGDAKQKESYKKCINGGEWVNLSKGSFRKNEPVLTTALYEAVEHNFSVEIFPCITKVEIEGPNPGILDCIAEASLIRSFHWKSPQTEVLDFRNLQQIHSFELDGTGVKRMYLPDDADLCNYGLSDVCELDIFEIKELDLGKIPLFFLNCVHSRCGENRAL